MNTKTYQITRKGILAVELMDNFGGVNIKAIVKRIMQEGPRNNCERKAVLKANKAVSEDELIPTGLARR